MLASSFTLRRSIKCFGMINRGSKYNNCLHTRSLSPTPRHETACKPKVSPSRPYHLYCICIHKTIHMLGLKALHAKQICGWGWQVLKCWRRLPQKDWPTLIKVDEFLALVVPHVPDPLRCSLLGDLRASGSDDFPEQMRNHLKHIDKWWCQDKSVVCHLCH